MFLIHHPCDLTDLQLDGNFMRHFVEDIPLYTDDSLVAFRLLLCVCVCVFTDTETYLQESNT